MSERGSLEALFRELTFVLGPLQSALQPDRARGFLAELGLPATAAQAGAIAGPLGAVSDGVAHLLALGNDLERAVQAGNTAAVFEQSLAALAGVGGVLGSFTALASAAGGLGLPGVTPAVVAELPRRIFNHLLTRYLARNVGVNELLELTGILERADHNVGSTDPATPFYTVDTFHFDQIGRWLQQPAVQLGDRYDWGRPGFDGKKLLPALEKVAAHLGLPALLAASGPALDLVSVVIKPAPGGLSVRFKDTMAAGAIERSGAGWTIRAEAGFPVLAGTEILLRPDGSVSLKPPDATTVAGKARVSFVNQHNPPAAPLLLLGVAGGTRVDVRQVSAFFEANLRWDGAAAQGSFAAGGDLKGGRAVIDAGQADGFLQKLLSGLHVESSFDLGFTYSLREGLHFHGSGGLDIQLASHISLGPIDLDALTLSAGIAGQSFPLAVAVNLKATLGPLVAVVEGIGLAVAVALASDNRGNLGPLDLRPGFKPPKGAGLKVDAGLVQGGGYLSFDSDRQEYAGVLQLDLLGLVKVTAIGLITTRMPDGSKGFSLLLILTAEFGTGIQLGLGFTLLAVGGLVGLNRTMLLQPLTTGIRTGAINSIMFPRDVIANAPRIISDLRAFFPPAEGRFLIGPMAKLGWGTPALVSLALGVIIEIPGDVAIIGVLRVALPADPIAILVLQVNFIGALEFSKKRVYFFAALFESHILSLAIEGELGVLAAFGGDANFVLSVGGFHPQFNPPPLPFPAPRRVSIDLVNTPIEHIRVEGYFAVTTNTVQFGARAEMFFGLDKVNVQGQIGFDALFQFSPFHFIIAVSASFSLHVFGAGLFSVGLDLSLEGPTPWRARGSGSIHILFVTVRANFDVTWGEKRDTTLPPIAVLPLIEAELAKAENWRALPPAGNNLLVSLRQLPPAEGALVLHPVGVLRVSQRALPLALKLDKVGNQKPNDVDRLELGVRPGGLAKRGDVFEQFAPAQYQNLSDGDKLSRPAYGPERGGLDLAAAGPLLAASRMVKRVVRYDQIVIDTNFKRFARKFFRLTTALFEFFLGGASASRCAMSQLQKQRLDPFAEKVLVKPEIYAVVFQATNQPHAGSSAAFQSEASAREYLRREIGKDPNAAATLQVIPGFERAA